MKIRFMFVFIGIIMHVGVAGAVSLMDSLRATYTACVGIDDALADLKKMAGINTAVTSVGTAAGVGATVTGFVKQSKDKEIAEIEELIAELKRMEDSYPAPSGADVSAFLADFRDYYTTATQSIAEDELDKLTKQSKNLGNWRTGLLAGSTATNIAGAVIAGTNQVDADLDAQIKNCVSSVDALRNAMMQARMNGQDITEATEIANACGEFAYVDVSPINKRGRGAMISGAVGAATGLAGTVTSAVANTDKTRDGDDKRERNLNTAANVLSIGTTAASATATVFNATQISAIKKVAAVAEKCAGVLK